MALSIYSNKFKNKPQNLEDSFEIKILKTSTNFCKKKENLKFLKSIHKKVLDK